MQGVGTPPGEGVPERYDTFEQDDMTVIYDKEQGGGAWIAAEETITING